MPRARTLVASLLLVLAPASWAQTAGRTQSCEAVVEAPVEQVWAAFTVKDQIESWMVPITSIDLRVGGEWRTSYNPASDLHDKDTIVHTILAYEPERMIAVRTRPPEGAGNLFGNVDFSQLWSVFRFEPVEGGTRVTVTGLGYGEGEAWDRVYNFFKTNNPLVLDELARHFGAQAPRDTAASSADTRRVLELLHTRMDGQWVHESRRPDGSLFRVRNVCTPGPDGVSVLCQGWLGDAEGLTPHSLAIVRRSMDGGVVFENVNQNGDVATGRITLAGENSIRWDWQVSRLDATHTQFEVTMDFPDDPDTYVFHLARIDHDADGNASRVPMIDVPFTRVAQAPEESQRTSPQPARSSGAAAR